jgi:phosphatidylethanolamine/phosphatidyl-N-methylethanolamine N-methyltransferase
MRERFQFLKEAIKDIKTTGSITGSSKFLIKNLLEHVCFEDAQVVVEFGAGSGVITSEILDCLPKDGKLLAFELNKTFCEHLKHMAEPRLQVLNDDVTHLLNYVAPQKVDAIISALPLLNMPDAVKRQILRVSREALKPGGKFIQYQYSLADHSLIKEYFNKVELDFTFLNVPPAFIYVAT